ncbi:MAG: flavodoxin family protein [Elusimicrobiota bacterium]
MSNILIIYFSKSGNTEKMAQYVEKGVREITSEVTIQKAQDVLSENLIEYDGIIIGSPTYYGLPASEIKKLLDKSVKFHGKLDGKIGGAFASSANTGGGNETTLLSILEALLIHGMIIKGTSKGDHYGPVSIGAPDDRVKRQCKSLGKRVALLANKIK